MVVRDPVAFMSYVRSDDDHDDGRITAFRKRLEGEVRMQTGKPFPIFQDRNDIRWGQEWKEMIDQSLNDVTFLIPILTPSFFHSPACRSEFETFTLKENTLGVNRLILPFYYVTCDQLGDEYTEGSDTFVDTIRARNWTDWRAFRFKSFSDEQVAGALAQMAGMIKASISELNAIKIAATSKVVSDSTESQQDGVVLSGLIPSLEENEEEESQTASSVTFAEERAAYPKYQIAEMADVLGRDNSAYYAFTTKFDEVVDAGLLAEPAELLALYRYVSSFTDKLKTRYQRSLNSMLAKLVCVTEKSPIAVTILIDNSGSMRGNKITYTAAWCLLIIDWMDRLGVPVEILGFTTRAWKGGQSREAWLTAGKPANPGRLNDLRYLIYKSFSASAESSAPNFGVMAREGLLKENIDGEALLWAASRLNQRHGEKKLLFVFSDGAPVDDSTLSVNPGNYLERHLYKAIDMVSSEITLYGLGLEHDVSRYYERVEIVEKINALGVRFFETLLSDPDFRAGWRIKKE